MKDYRSTGSVPYERPDRYGFASLDVLPFLVGRRWDDRALAFVHSLRPSSIRVTTGEEKSDSRIWRVTVHVDADDVIESISQEVEVGLPSDWRYGADATAWMKQQADASGAPGGSLGAAVAQLRHLYDHMVNGRVHDTAEAARGLLGPSIERIEKSLWRLGGWLMDSSGFAGFSPLVPFFWAALVVIPLAACCACAYAGCQYGRARCAEECAPAPLPPGRIDVACDRRLPPEDP